jgi:hypothetical protein
LLYSIHAGHPDAARRGTAARCFGSTSRAIARADSEEALAERVDRETAVKAAKPKRTREEFDAWILQFAAYSDKIPSMPGETFSRAMIYQDHN